MDLQAISDSLREELKSNDFSLTLQNEAVLEALDTLREDLIRGGFGKPNRGMRGGSSVNTTKIAKAVDEIITMVKARDPGGDAVRNRV